MRKFISIALIVSLSVNAFARAGTSHSSSRSSSGSSSYSKSNSNYGTKANYSRPTTQYSTTAVKPVATPVKVAQPTYTPIKPVATPINYNRTYSKPAPAQQNYTPASSNTYNRSAGNNYNSGGYSNQHPNNTPATQQSTGSGIMSTIVGVGGGIVAGSLITDWIRGGHDKSSSSSHSGTSHSAPTYNGAPVTYQNGEPIYTDNQGVVQQVPNGMVEYKYNGRPSEKSNEYSFLSFILSSIFWLLIIGVIVYVGRKIYRKYTVRKNTDNADTRDKSLPIFKNSFIDIQSAYGSSFNEANMSRLATLCTTEMYDYFMLIKSENEEKGLTNIVKDVNVISIITTNYIEDAFTGKIHHTVKIRFSMIDYTLDNSDTVIDGDMYKSDVDTEMWTFVSDNTTWKLSAIEQYQA